MSRKRKGRNLVRPRSPSASHTSALAYRVFGLRSRWGREVSGRAATEGDKSLLGSRVIFRPAVQEQTCTRHQQQDIESTTPLRSRSQAFLQQQDRPTEQQQKRESPTHEFLPQDGMTTQIRCIPRRATDRYTARPRILSLRDTAGPGVSCPPQPPPVLGLRFEDWRGGPHRD